MPLNLPGLTADLTSLFENPPATEAECAQAWSNALLSYAAAITPPSTTVTAAANALTGALSGMSTPNAALAIFSAALSTFATTIGSGMTPTGTPPATPILVALQAAWGSNTDSAATAAASTANAIDSWLRTGFVPGTPPIPWA